MAFVQNLPGPTGIQAAAQSGLVQPVIPPTGLIGAEQALQGGLGGALSSLLSGVETARGDIRDVSRTVGAGITRGAGALRPFADPGARAFGEQAALSGALGPEAEAAAFSRFTESPAQRFQREQAERALLRSESAIGGLGGGRVREELQRQAIGLAQQNIGERFGQLGALSQIGAGAAAGRADLFGRGAGLQAGLGTRAADIASRAGEFGAGLFQTTGRDIAGGRTRAGEQIAGGVGTTTSALADLISQQGAGVSDILGRTTGNIADLIAAAGQQQGASAQNLASLLASIATGSGAQVAGLPGLPSLQPNQGILSGLGQLASGVGSVIGAFPGGGAAPGVAAPAGTSLPAVGSFPVLNTTGSDLSLGGF